MPFLMLEQQPQLFAATTNIQAKQRHCKGFCFSSSGVKHMIKNTQGVENTLI